MGCFRFLVVAVVGCVLFLWIALPDEDTSTRCDIQCQVEIDKCDFAHLKLIEANDFDRERLQISEGEHSRRERSIRMSHIHCWERAESASARRRRE